VKIDYGFKDQALSKTFIVTNKHVIDSDPSSILEVPNIDVHVNELLAPNRVRKKVITLTIRDGDQYYWLGHPDENIDVAVIELRRVVIENNQLVHRPLDWTRVCTRKLIQSSDVSWADEIVSVGYPDGLDQGTNCYPIVRSGLISSQIGEPLSLPDGPAGKLVDLPGFLIDLPTRGGSSGSPIVLKPVVGRDVHGLCEHGPAEPRLLGIVSDKIQTIAWADQPAQDLHLGFAFDAQCILETISAYINRVEKIGNLVEIMDSMVKMPDWAQ
jgi:hypothetical protein